MTDERWTDSEWGGEITLDDVLVSVTTTIPPSTVVPKLTTVGAVITTSAPVEIVCEILYPSGRIEGVSKGSSFTELYTAASTYSVLANVYTYSIRRLGGFPESPTLIFS